MAFVVSEGCIDIKDKACLADCPVDCIYEGGRMTYIHPDQCIDCGACEPLCPQDAIYFDADLPDQLKIWAVINSDFFADAGDPTNSRDVDLTGRDHPTVTAMPPRA